MKASEARQLVELASKNLAAKDQAQYDKIMDKIKTEINLNLATHVWIYENLSPALIKRLKDDGYQISNEGNQFESTMYFISWEVMSSSDYYNK